MTIIADIEEAIKLERYRRQPSLPLLPFSVPALLRDIHSSIFADVTHSVSVYFVIRGPLACIVDEKSYASIYIHQLLNHQDTPKEVMTMIIKHELLHLRIPPTTVGGKIVQHSPEFRKVERQISPEGQLAWNWIWINFSLCLRKRPRLERIDVLPRWKEFWCTQRSSIEQCQRIVKMEPDGENGWV